MEQIVAAATAIAIIILPAQKDSAPKPLEKPIEQKVVVHTVKDGESLASIAKDYYGKTDYWTNVWNRNDWIKNPDLVEKYWKLKLGKKDEKVEQLSKNLSMIYSSKRFYSYTPKTSTSTVSTNSQPLPTPPSNFDEVYKDAGEKHGVPWQILYGLHLTETGLRDGAIFNKQGSGAQGPMQFMPGTFRAYAVDGNGDGSKDINNAVDSIHTAANFLQRHGTIAQGLRSYGGNTTGTLNAARAQGYTQ